MNLNQERDRRGAAYHEAGHAVVAWALGLQIGEIEIAIGGDDAKGRAEIENGEGLPLIDRLAICVAGMEAQDLFSAPTHENAGFGDHVKVRDLLETIEDEEAGFALRMSGHQRAREILTKNEETAVRLAEALIKLNKLDGSAVFQLIGPSPD